MSRRTSRSPRSRPASPILARGLRARGDLQAVNRDMAVAHADRAPVELVADLRTLADSRRKPAITTVDNLRLTGRTAAALPQLIGPGAERLAATAASPQPTRPNPNHDRPT